MIEFLEFLQYPLGDVAMNATEQRTHRTVTQSLEARVAVLETIVAQLGNNCEWLKRHADKDAELIRSLELRADITDLRQSSFSARLRWLFLGR